MRRQQPNASPHTHTPCNQTGSPHQLHCARRVLQLLHTVRQKGQHARAAAAAQQARKRAAVGAKLLCQGRLLLLQLLWGQGQQLRVTPQRCRQL